MPLNRFDPQMTAAEYKTYQLSAPPGSIRPATCERVECAAFLAGWVTRVDESTDLGHQQAQFIRFGSGRRFTEERDGGLTVFTFPAGQKCFGEHTTRDGRPPLYIVRGGDWRGNPTGEQPRYHARGENWVEDFQEHQQTLAHQLEKG